MYDLPQDVIRKIAKNLELNSVLGFACTSKYFNNTLDNIFYKNMAIKYYSNEFWIKANKRPVKLSKPLKNMKYELIRINNFQNKLEKNEMKKWELIDFYSYWNLQIKFLK